VTILKITHMLWIIARGVRAEARHPGGRHCG
jgi:hypothetical protein